MKAAVLQHQHMPWSYPVNSRLHLRPHAILGHLDRSPQQCSQPPRYRPEAELWIGAALWPAKVGDKHDLRPMSDRVADRRKGAADARVVGDRPLLVDRDVEIDANQEPFPLELQVIDTEYGHHSSLHSTRTSVRRVPYIGRISGFQARPYLA